MTGHRQKLDGEGYDALTRAKRWYRWPAGVRKAIKRRHRKRQRKEFSGVDWRGYQQGSHKPRDAGSNPAPAPNSLGVAQTGRAPALGARSR